MAGKWGKFWRAAAALSLIFVLAVTPAVRMQTTAATSLSDLQKKQNELKQQQQQTASELKKLKADRDKQQEYKNALDNQMANLQGQIDNLNEQIIGLDAEIAQKESEIADKQANIDYDFDLLKQRLRALYLAGEATTLQIILSSENVTDFIQKTEFMQAITDHDTKLINGLKEDMAAIKVEKEQIEESRKQAAEAKKELDAKSNELSELVEESKKVLAELNANVVEVNSKNNELAREKQKADAAVDQWYKDYYAKLAAEGNSGNQASGGYASTGNFTWPCPGYTKLTSYWGDGRNHKGIDIAGSGIYGKAIVAADSGKVIQAVHSGWGGGYGLCVYLDHGNGYSTRYGHMSKVLVNTGDVVQKGQVIGYVGSTGDSSGPHLHFEIRVNGVAKNPMNWFK